MPAAPSPLAITAVTFPFTIKAEVTKTLKEGDPVLTNDDEFEVADAYDPTYEISVEGKGDAPEGIAAAVVDPDGIEIITTGKTLVDGVTSRQKNEGRNEWSMTAKNFPSAS